MREAAVSERFKTFFHWTRGHEIAAWIQLHEADRVISTTYDLDQTVARLRVAVQELRPDYAKVADAVETALATIGTNKPATEGYLKALLWEALDCVYDARDDSYELIFSWQNKAFTLLFISGCVLLVITANSFNALLMLMGLAGGLVSRLLRGSQGTEIPRDYGANWTTLFMSPIYGAFTGWFGVLILAAMKKMSLLGSAFDVLDWTEASGQPVPLALAFLFGFSERAFSAVSDSLEKAMAGNLRKSPSNPPGLPGGAPGGKDAGTPVTAPQPQLQPTQQMPPEPAG
jgi:hypothetical protein